MPGVRPMLVLEQLLLSHRRTERPAMIEHRAPIACSRICELDAHPLTIAHAFAPSLLPEVLLSS